MSIIVIRCCRWVTVGEGHRLWGCGALRDEHGWRPASDPMEAAADGAICPGCLARLTEAQERARVRIEQACSRRAERGYGPGDGDAFEGF